VPTDNAEPMRLESRPASNAVNVGGKILVGGSLTNFNGPAPINWARLNPDGSLNTNFNPVPPPQTKEESLYVAKEVLLDQSAVQSATFGKSPQGYAEIGITLTDAGRKQFAEITREHLHQRLAMVIDGKLWMAPVVQEPITAGKATITGGFSDEEAKDLIAQINEAAGN
jgi:preprotein translocase subunit SecD